MKRLASLTAVVLLLAASPVAAHPSATWVMPEQKATDDRCPADRMARLYMDADFGGWMLKLCGDAHDLAHDPHNAGAPIYNFLAKITSVRISDWPYDPAGRYWVLALYEWPSYENRCRAISRTSSPVTNLSAAGCNDAIWSVRWELWQG
jgi:hypothetical protein